MPKPALPDPQFVSYSAIVDALVVASLPEKMVAEMLLHEALSNSRLLLRLPFEGAKSVDHWPVGVFVVEAKCKDLETALKQVAAYMVATQRHRQVLGLLDRVVYGAVYVDNTFQLVVSAFKKEMVVSTDVVIT